jgi:hypothetical protein
MEAVLYGPLGRTLLGPDELAIGYDPDNQLIVTDIKTAAHHALIRPDGTGYAIVDLGSAYGTRINGQWLSPNVARPLQSGDIIQIGDTSFTYDTSSLPSIMVDPLVNGAQAPVYALTASTLATSVADTGYGPGGFLTARPAGRVVASSPIAPPQLPYTPQPWVSGGMSAYPPQAQLWQKDRRRALISLGILVAILVVGIALGVTLNRSTPDKTLDTFCNALLSGNGQLAFNQFSANFQKQIGQTNPFLFIKVTACTHTPAVVNGATATASITVVVAQTPQPSSSSNTSTATLVQDANGAWKIDNLQTQ